ncbi:MAG: hypothetical protein K9N49_01765 [Candidatus Marinimicrobia bacterium]|nr:hypothetical protein [Candidatus Neomarinimicrobiota bacterium]
MKLPWLRIALCLTVLAAGACGRRRTAPAELAGQWEVAAAEAARQAGAAGRVLLLAAGDPRQADRDPALKAIRAVLAGARVRLAGVVWFPPEDGLGPNAELRLPNAIFEQARRDYPEANVFLSLAGPLMTRGAARETGAPQLVALCPLVAPAQRAAWLAARLADTLIAPQPDGSASIERADPPPKP